MILFLFFQMIFFNSEKKDLDPFNLDIIRGKKIFWNLMEYLFKQFVFILFYNFVNLEQSFKKC